MVELAPAGVTVAVAGRLEPGPAMARLSLAPDTTRNSADDLRFGAWEVGQLFDGLYREPLPPEDVAALARHTEG